MSVTRFALCRLTLLMVAVLSSNSLLAQDPVLIKIPEDQPALEFIGQFINDSSGSHQYGYISRIQGLSLSAIFSGTPQNENTALFTFCTEATTVRAVPNGVLTIVNRVGTTTILFTSNPAPRNPIDRSSFCSGTPVQISSYQQQVVVDSATGSFSTIHVNSITGVSAFELNGTSYQLGQPGKAFRTNYQGHVNPGPPPSGWFGGYAVGIK